MDLVSIAGWLKDLASALSGLGITAGGMVVVAGFVLLYSRTLSAHPVLTLLWTRLFGKLATDDPKVQKLVDELNNLSRFTFLTRIRSRTEVDMHNLVDWCRQWNVAPAEVHACGSNFDLVSPGLKNGKSPGRLSVGFMLFAASFVTTLGAASTGFMVPDSALVTFKTSGDSLWLSETSAQRFLPRGKLALDSRDCKEPLKDLSERTGFVQGDVEMLCSFFSGKEGSTAGIVEKFVRQNRIAFGVVGLLLYSFALVIWGEWRRGRAANQLSDHLAKHEAKVKRSSEVARDPIGDEKHAECNLPSDEGGTSTAPKAKAGTPEVALQE